MLKIKEKLSLILVLLLMITLMPINILTNKTYAAETFKVGDYIQFGKYYGKPILWRVINVDDDGSPMLYSEKILCLKAFDAAESGKCYKPGNDPYNREASGSNKWENSNIREWLNSSEIKVSYTTQPPTKEAVLSGYNAYVNEAGFLSNFTESERNAIKEVTKKSILAEIDKAEKEGGTEEHYYSSDRYKNMSNSVENFDKAYYKNIRDKVYFLDIKELHDYVYDRGWEFRKKPTVEAVKNSEYKSNNLVEYKYWSNWLKTPAFSHAVRYMQENKQPFSLSAADYEGGVAPALNLKPETLKSGGSGIESDPYIIAGKTVSVEGITLNKPTITITAGSSQTVVANITPEDAADKSVKWSSNDTSIATVDASGKVTGVKQGTTAITATTTDGGKTAICVVTVGAAPLPVNNIVLNKSTLSLVEGTTEQLFAVITPTNASNKKTIWDSTDKKVATVDQSGNIVATGVGKAAITATTEDGNKTAMCIVTVTPFINEIKVTALSLNKKSSNLTVGFSQILKPIISPDNATNKVLNWSSSNSNIVSVDPKGKITAVSEGTAIIKATTEDGGINAECSITVINESQSIWKNYKEIKSINSVSKSWTIAFTHDLKASTIDNESVYVATDEEGKNKIENVGVSLGSTDKEIIFNTYNKSLWKSGEIYYLFITTNVQSATGKNLKKPIRMQFTVK